MALTPNLIVWTVVLDSSGLNKDTGLYYMFLCNIYDGNCIRISDKKTMTVVITLHSLLK